MVRSAYAKPLDYRSGVKRPSAHPELVEGRRKVRFLLADFILEPVEGHHERS